MVSHKALFLFATTAFAATVHLSTRSPRSELILADLKNLDSSVLVLKAAISDYIGGVLDATPILLGITDVHLANRKTYYDSFIIGNQSVEDSKTIIDYVSNPIAIDIPNTVEITKSKKQLFVDAGLNGTVIESLDLLKYDHDSLSAALESKLPAELLAQAEVPVRRLMIRSRVELIISNLDPEDVGA